MGRGLPAVVEGLKKRTPTLVKLTDVVLNSHGESSTGHDGTNVVGVAENWTNSRRATQVINLMNGCKASTGATTP